MGFSNLESVNNLGGIVYRLPPRNARIKTITGPAIMMSPTEVNWSTTVQLMPLKRFKAASIVMPFLPSQVFNSFFRRISVDSTPPVYSLRQFVLE